MHVLISDHTSSFLHTELFILKRQRVTKETVIIVELLWQTSDILMCLTRLLRDMCAECGGRGWRSEQTGL